MIPVLFGMAGASWLRSLMNDGSLYKWFGGGSPEVDLSEYRDLNKEYIKHRRDMMSGRVFMTDYKISENMFEVIKEYESLMPNAYVVPGEGFYTIGYGSTRIFSADGKASRPVMKGDVLTKDQAIFQMKMYYSRPGSVKEQVDKVIRLSGVTLHQRFYDMLCQIAYGSGGFHKTVGYRDMLRKADKVADLGYLAKLIVSYYISYLKSIRKRVKWKRELDYIYFPDMKRPSNKGGYGLGWSRRAYGVAQYILGNDFSFAHSYKVIKKPY